ncbi:hypothetical protein SLEP1_g55231 [Rubroshorea leprosula]|uniref:Uncharacterized protein n=1 Tax=Rubroshorea leprosula TaxID=152421 RepID=A0AAV5MET5_9ROSI|nr:hypothetical protein SLEP1_g55231 [Rubroshorea leprosula]
MGVQTSCKDKCTEADIGWNYRLAKGYDWCKNPLFR